MSRPISLILLFLCSIILLCGCGIDTTDDHLSEKQPVSEEPIPHPRPVCADPSFDLMVNIRQAVEELSGTPYSQANKTDCSGMFHKVLNRIRKVCPKASIPKITQERASRDIARWYRDNGYFHIIRSPENSSHLIQPGMVMFYGYGSRNGQYDYPNLTIDSLVTPGTGINHVAIVTRVNRKDGVVESYDIFHGRNPRYPAGVTTSRRVYPHQTGLPAYGNWNEPWLAAAHMLAPAE